ncbi:MAG: hypothetical protein C4295_02090 [Candidatus Fervidibacterota bacterium]
MGERKIWTLCRRKSGISIIEVITAMAILGIGIWAIVALFPKGQNIIRRSGLRQLAVQLSHEAISDYLTNPAKMPFALVPYDPNQVPNAPILLEPADLLRVRAAYNFVWGEPLELVPVDTDGDGAPNEWRAILHFAPVMDLNGDGQVDGKDVRVYREVRYLPFPYEDRNGDGTIDARDVENMEYLFDPQNSPTDVYLSLRPGWTRVLRVSYELATPFGPVTQVHRELYLVDGGTNRFSLHRPASRILSIVEEVRLTPNADNVLAKYELRPFGVLRFGSSVPRPSFVPLANDPRLGRLLVDYLIDDAQNGGGHWLLETGTTFAPDLALRQRLNLPANRNVGVFQTVFGNLVPTAVQAILLDVGPNWGAPLTIFTLPQEGVLAFELANQPLPPSARVRVAYQTGDDWFVQVIKPPDNFQLAPDNTQVLQQFPYERLRWFDPTALRQGVLRVSPLLAGLSLQLRWLGTNGVTYETIASVDGSGQVRLPSNLARLNAIQGASLLVRLSGRTLWQQAPPQRKGDYVELTTIVPPAQTVQP